jgi:multidrug efflux pump subunit AcrA (membrane-fusion protein)
MKVAALALIGCLVLAGCTGSGAHAKACEVMSPASVDVPTTQNDQRVEANATGEPSGRGHNEQNCP